TGTVGSGGTGNGSFAGQTYTVDHTGPSVVTTFPVSNATYNTVGWNAGCATAGICGTSSDATSGVATVKVQIRDGVNSGKYWNGSTWQGAAFTFTASGTTPWNQPLATSALTNGTTYTVNAFGTDAVGNVGSTTTSFFTYDTTPPTVSSITRVTATPTNAANV